MNSWSSAEKHSSRFPEAGISEKRSPVNKWMAGDSELNRRTLDWQLARAQTAGSSGTTHFNNAGAALMPDCVVQAALNHLMLETQMGGYEAADQSADHVLHTYEAAAKLLNCSPTEIAIVESASRAWSLAFSSLSFSPGDVVITTPYEYANNYMVMLQAHQRYGVQIAVIACQQDGELSLTFLRSLIQQFGFQIRLVSISHVPTNNGLVNPVEGIGNIIIEARRNGSMSPNTLYIVDACQSAGQVKLDVQAFNCDILTTCSRKYLRGPRGLGMLYVRKGALDPESGWEPRMLDVRSARWVSRDEYELVGNATMFETWEGNVGSKIALGIAIDYALLWDISVIEADVAALASVLRGRLAALAGVTIQERGQLHCGIVTFSLDACDPKSLVAYLRASRINIGTSECDLTRIDMESRGLSSVARASVHYFNSFEEIDRLVDGVDAFLRQGIS